MIADGGSCSSSTLCANRCCTKEGSGDNQNRCQSGSNAFNCLGSQVVIVADKCVEAGMIALTYDVIFYLHIYFSLILNRMAHKILKPILYLL